jgi:hypothetical protein
LTLRSTRLPRSGGACAEAQRDRCLVIERASPRPRHRPCPPPASAARRVVGRLQRRGSHAAARAPGLRRRRPVTGMQSRSVDSAADRSGSCRCGERRCRARIAGVSGACGRGTVAPSAGPRIAGLRAPRLLGRLALASHVTASRTAMAMNDGPVMPKERAAVPHVPSPPGSTSRRRAR